MGGCLVRGLQSVDRSRRHEQANQDHPTHHTEYNAYDNDPWILRVVEFTKAVLAQDRVKFIGVCWGHQILGRALGAKVAKSESGAWEVSVCQFINTERGRELFGGKDVLVS